MSEIGVPFDPGDKEPLPFIPGIPGPEAPEPPIPPGPVEPTEPTEPEPEPGVIPSPPEPDSGAVPGIDKLAMILLIIALVLAAKALTDFFNWLFQKALLPFGGGSKPVKLGGQAVTQALGSYLGSFGQSFDPEVGTAFTQMAVTGGLISRSFVSLAARILRTAQAVSQLAAANASLHETTQSLRHVQQGQTATSRDLVRQTGLQARRAVQNETAAAAQLHGMATYITTILEPELEGLRKRIPKLEKGHADNTKRIESHDHDLGIDAMVGTVATAMSRLGAGWTRCDTNREIGEALCGTSTNTVQKLLKDGLGLLGIVEVCGLVGLLGAAVGNPVIVDGLALFSTAIEDLLHCTGATLADPLDTPQATLAPPSPLAALAPVTV